MSKTRLADMTRSIVTALVMALMLVWGMPASAQQAKCLAGKTKCMSKKGAGLLKCHAASETPGKVADPNAAGCVDKVVAKFDGGVDPSKGCFEKLESKPGSDCITFDDTGSAEAAVDACVMQVVADIDPGAIDQTKCGAAKKKCVSKYLAGLLKCQASAQTPGKSTDPNFGGCRDKALAKYDGGIDPTKGCFAKIENNPSNDCLPPTGNSATLAATAENCVDDYVANVLTNTTTTTSTTFASTTLASTTTTSTLPSGGVELQGALTATVGRFNYNLTLGLPGANAACNSNFPGTHACEYTELQTAEAAGDLVGLKDTGLNTVTGFWVINNSVPLDLTQCNDDQTGGSDLNWEYGTADTPSRGKKVPLNNGTGVLGAVGPNVQCNLSGTSWVGCCI
jgi:hypothetical protein